MIYRYCLKCKKIRTRQHWLTQNNRFFCASCKYGLVYFGREAVDISPPDVFQLYDLKHKYDPISDYKAYYKNYDSRFPSEAILECEDILKYDPNKLEPLLFLAQYHLARKKIGLALRNIKKILDIEPNHIEALKMQLNIFTYKQKYKLMLPVLKKLETISENKFDVYHQFGIVYLALNNFENAVDYFYRAYHLTENELIQKKIKGIIRMIHAQLEK